MKLASLSPKKLQILLTLVSLGISLLTTFAILKPTAISHGFEDARRALLEVLLQDIKNAGIKIQGV